MGKFLRYSTLAGLAALALLAPACSDDTVFIERPFFDDPPNSARGFLGYGTPEDQESKLTTCGNCHVGKQLQWEATNHADAWNTLQASGSAQEFCEGCHTVGPNGNTATEGGWAATGEPRYYDVQCENCHGPGQMHVLNPDASQPLASAMVGDTTTGNCGDCHSGSHHPFVDEWEASPHANIVGFAAANPSCQPCHLGQGTLLAWGEDADYVEKFSEDPLPVVCVVCHDPHGSENVHQLRFPIKTTAIEEHLCARCHDRRTVPDPGSSHGLAPHSPESALLVGNAGWFPPNSNIEAGRIIGSHGSEANEELCATCHLVKTTVTDDLTGDFVFAATGHLFRPIPCLDSLGIPQGFDNQCGLGTDERAYSSCADGGCHGNEVAAFSALTTAVNRIQPLADELLNLLMQVDSALDAPGGEIDPTDPAFTVAEGAFFNHALAIHGSDDFGTNTVVGSAVHNPFLMEGLLAGSIQAVEDEYGVMAPSGKVDWDKRIEEVKARIR